MDRFRKKLIEELIRVGHLVDPESDEEQHKIHQEVIKHSTNLEKPDTYTSAQERDLDALPKVNHFIDEPYATKDMFSTSAKNHAPDVVGPLETQQRDPNTSDCNDFQKGVPGELPATQLATKIDKKENIIGFPVEELARELVSLIEDRVSLRSGEQLDDALRDDLTQAVTTQLEGWLKFD